MNIFIIRPLVAATLALGIAIAYEANSPPTLVGIEVDRRGYIHRRAVRAFEQRQLALRDSIVRLAQSQLGVPYLLGGTSPGHAFDCSGLVSWVFAQVHVAQPRTARQQARAGLPIQRDYLRAGDVVAFGQADSVTHIGIYIGDGRFVHASSVAGKVVVSPLDRPPSKLIRPLAGARRVLVTAAAPASTGGG